MFYKRNLSLIFFIIFLFIIQQICLYFRSSVRVKEKYARIFYNKAISSNGNLVLKKNFLEKSIYFDPLYAKAYKELAMIYQKDNDFKKAFLYNLKAINLDFSLNESALYLGTVYLRNNSFIQASRYFNLARNFDYKNYLIYYYLGFTCEKLSFYQSAIQHYKDCIIFNPDFVLGKGKFFKLIEQYGNLPLVRDIIEEFRTHQDNDFEDVLAGIFKIY